MKKKKIKIGIDGGDFAIGNYPQNGIQRILASILNQLKDYEVNYYHFGFGGLPRRFFSSFWLPLRNFIDENDVFLGFSGNIPFFLRFSKAKKIAFLYDFGFMKYPQFYSNPKKLLKNTKSTIKYSDKIVVLSNYGKKQIRKVFPHSYSKKIVRIYPGVNHLPADISSKNKYGDYLLYVGVIKPVKNVVQLFKYLNNQNKSTKLILVGKREKQYFNEITKTKEYLSNRRRIIFKENATDEELVGLYKNCEAVLNFSYEEGFCFPAAEALYFRKRLITNNHPIYKELKSNFRWNEFIAKLSDLIKHLINE